MKYKRFDVVELNNGNKATILDIQRNGYLAEVVNKKGESLGNKVITDSDINDVVVAKN